ncbi:MAG: hypothetical protein A2219_05550 [Elusimicrobia bacterium RIFOXYA2_FULL_50_26]|nr:MAG: hypothetical protein A2219_05550 [Elusimicrobia bacterium RIFOXYA2_FULL_50_26]
MITMFGYQITIFQILATVMGIGFLVFIHELGHFLMAKKFKIPVEKFAFGFGPELVGFTYGETRYSICAIPLGGMVKMPGESADSATGAPGEFLSQPWYRRLTIALFGPLMNYALAIILFGVVVYVWGLPNPSPLPIVGQVIESFPAEQAGLRSGDQITAINGIGIKTWAGMADFIHSHTDEKLQFSVKRGEEILSITITPKKDPASGMGLVGISPSMTTEKVGLIRSAGIGTRAVAYQSYFTLKYLGEKIIKWEKPELAGPIGVIQILAKAAKAGWENLIYLLAVISTALGLFNLLPIPILDGGHIFIALIEGITRRPLSRKSMQTANLIGFGIIMFIFIFATYSDLARSGILFKQ